MLLTILLPPVYTSLFIRPAIEEGFRQATSDKYAIAFDEINWNLLGRKLSMNKIRVFPLFESDSMDRVDLKLDQLSIEKIKYGKLLKGSIKLDKLSLDGLVIYREQGSKPNKQKNEESQLGMLQSLDIGEIKLDIDTVLFIKDSDSILNISNGKINIDSFIWDSDSHDKIKSLPKIEKMSSSFGALIINNDQSKIRLKNFKISENKLSQFDALFESIDFEDRLKGNSLFLKWASLEIDSAQHMYVDSTLNIKIKKLLIESDSLIIDQKVQEQFKPEIFIDNLKDFASKTGVNVQLDKWTIKTKTAQIDQVNWKAWLKEYELNIGELKLSDKEARIASYALTLGNSLLSLKKKSDSIKFSFLRLENDKLIIQKPHIKPENAQFEFDSKQINIKGLSFRDLIFNEKLLLNEISIKEPFMEIKNVGSENRTPIIYPLDFTIDKLLVEDGNLNHDPHKLSVSSFNLKVDDLSGRRGNVLKLDSVFNRLRFDSRNISLVNKEEEIFSEVKNIAIDSKEGLLSLSKLSLKQNLQNNSVDFVSNDLYFKGIDWKGFLNTPTFLHIDSIACKSILVNGDNNNILGNKESISKLLDFKIENINLPQIEVHYKFGENKSLYFEKLNLSADSLLFLSNEKRPLTFSKLELLSGYSSYAQDCDSLLFTSEGWEYISKGSKWYSKGVFINHIFSNDTIKATSNLVLNIPMVTITGLDPYDYFMDKKIGLDSINVTKPRINFKGERNRKSKNKNTLNWQQEIRKIAEKFVYIDLRYINVSDAEFEVENKYLGRQDKISLENAGLEIRSFYLDYQRFKDWDRFLFSDYFNLNFSNYFHSINSGQYLFDIHHGKINSGNRSLRLKGIHFLSLSEYAKFPVNLEVGEFGLNNFYLNATTYLPELEIASMFLKDSDIQLKTRKQQDKNAKMSLDSIYLYKHFKNYLNAVEVGELDLIDCNLDLGAVGQKLLVNNVEANIKGVRIDSLNKIFTRDKFFYSNNLKISIPDYSWVSKDRLYKYQFEELRFNSLERNIEVDSFQIISQYDRKTFAANLEWQKDQVDALFPLIKISDIDLRDAISRERFTARKFELFEPELRMYKDKTIKVDTSDYKYMPAKQLQNLKIYLNIDTALVYNGFVRYDEYAGLMETPGKIFFNNMNIRFTGLSNDKDFADFGGTLRILANGKLMGKSDVSVTAVFPLKSKEQEFIALASMSQLDAVELNPLIQPLTLLSAKEGNLMQLQMNIKGNNDYAYGEMLLKYEDLKVEILNRKKHKESSLATFLANSFMIRRNNNNFLFPRKGPIYYERVTYRSFIHYLSHFAIVGAKTSIGIDKRKIQKKKNGATTLEIEQSY